LPNTGKTCLKKPDMDRFGFSRPRVISGYSISVESMGAPATPHQGHLHLRCEDHVCIAQVLGPVTSEADFESLALGVRFHILEVGAVQVVVVNRLQRSPVAASEPRVTQCRHVDLVVVVGEPGNQIHKALPVRAVAVSGRHESALSRNQTGV